MPLVWLASARGGGCKFVPKQLQLGDSNCLVTPCRIHSQGWSGLIGGRWHLLKAFKGMQPVFPEAENSTTDKQQAC